MECKFDNEIPAIYEAVEVATPNSVGEKVVLEVLQQLEGGIVRCIAMVSTDGLSRGSEVVATGSPIKAPVGPEVLGCIFNVLGERVDGGEKIKASDYRSIHRAPPKFVNLTTSAQLLTTGIKVIDLLAPVLR